MSLFLPTAELAAQWPMSMRDNVLGVLVNRVGGAIPRAPGRMLQIFRNRAVYSHFNHPLRLAAVTTKRSRSHSFAISIYGNLATNPA